MNFRSSVLLALSVGTVAAVAAEMPIDPAIPPPTPTNEAPVVINGAFAAGGATRAKLSSSPQRRAPSTLRPSVARAPALFAATGDGVGAPAKALTDYPQDLQNIVRACGGDALKLFEIVRNEVRFQPYRGFRKGPVLTWQTKSGSDADQSQLLVELLHAAGYEAFYYYGVAVLPEAEAFAWWGADNLTAMNMLTGSSGYSAGSTGDGNYAVEQIFVVVKIGSSYHYWVPAFKTMEESTGIDLVAATGYNRANLLAVAGGTVTATAVQGVSESAVTGYLADRAAALRTVIHNDHPNASVGEIVGERRIVPLTLGDPNEGLPAGWDVLSGFDNFAFDDPYASYSGNAPGTTFTFATTMRLYIGPSNAAGTDLSSYIVMFGGQMSDFAGHQVTVGFSAANKVQILIDGLVVGEAASPYAGELGMKYYIDHPYVAGAATAYDEAKFNRVRAGGRYALSVGTGAMNAARFSNGSAPGSTHWSGKVWRQRLQSELTPLCACWAWIGCGNATNPRTCSRALSGCSTSSITPLPWPAKRRASLWTFRWLAWALPETA
ncbi:MAG: hypothetical protein IPL39_21730 [Opitutaceae bacterium]|nr:hypothetical protein [Opitutaceae bacterium]